MHVPWVQLVAVLLAALCEIGCGDVFRPIAQPIPLPPPNPAAGHLVLALASNGTSDAGTLSRIDVSGDSVSSIFTTGVAPVYAAFAGGGSKVYVANSVEDTVSSNSSSSPTQATTISLPQLCGGSGCVASHPVFVTSTETGKMYVANSGTGTVSVINTASDVVIATVSVDPAFAGTPLPAPNPAANPVALAELPNGSRVYSVNQGDGTVSRINTLDDTVSTPRITMPAAPIWAVASSDSAFVYVLDTNGTISAINTLSDTITGSASAGPGANFMFYDAVFSRLYVTNPNPAAATVSIFDVAANILTPHIGSPVPIAPAASSPCTSAPMPSSVTVLGDGSRAYVASFQPDASSVCTQATVIDSGTGTVSSIIPLTQSANLATQSGCDTARFRTFATASGGGTNSLFKVYISQCDAGSVAVVDTFASNTGTNQHPADVLEATVPAPLSSFPPLSGQANPPSQNPVFVLAGP